MGLLCNILGWHEGQTVGCVVGAQPWVCCGPVRQASCVRKAPSREQAYVVSAPQGPELVVGTAIQTDHALDVHGVSDGHGYMVDLNVLQAAGKGVPDGGLWHLPVGCNRKSRDSHGAGHTVKWKAVGGELAGPGLSCSVTSSLSGPPTPTSTGCSSNSPKEIPQPKSTDGD